MTAYVIVDIAVQDPVRYEDYKAMAAPTIGLYGGRYVARGGATEVLEGTWQPNRLVILEFADVAQAKKWLNSPEYAAARQLRHETAISNMVVVAGLSAQ